VPAGHLNKLCSFSVKKLSVVHGTNCLLFDDGIVGARITASILQKAVNFYSMAKYSLFQWSAQFQIACFS